MLEYDYTFPHKKINLYIIYLDSKFNNLDLRQVYV